MLGGYGLRTVLRAELNRNGSADLTPVDTRALPSLDVVVAARDEEGVVTRLWSGSHRCVIQLIASPPG